MRDSDCPCRSGATAQSLFTARDSVTGDEFSIVRCAACGLARTDPQPSEVALNRYYPTEYHPATRRYRFGLDGVLSLVHRSRIRRIERLTGGPGRVLDVGCGPGWLLDHMRARGWETHGTERSDGAARHARDVLNLDVSTRGVDDLVREGCSFDAVVLWHVAEHVHDPAALFEGVAQLLRPGGVAVLGVPNFGSVESKLAKQAWFHLDVPRHLFHFTPSSLRRMLADAGLESRLERYTAPEYDVFSFVQTVQNRAGLPPNYLYNLIRRNEARLAHRESSARLAIVAVATAVPLTLIGFVWAPIAALLRRGSSVTVYAQRGPTVGSVRT